MQVLKKVYYLRVILGIIAAATSIGYLFVTGAISTNLVANPSVEQGTTTSNDWFPAGNGTAWSTAYAKTGVRSLRLNVDNSSGEWKSKSIVISEGNTYQIQGYFRGTITEDQFQLIVRWFSDAEGLTSIKEDKISLPVHDYSQWIPLGGAFTAPSRAKSCAIIFNAENGTGDLYGDNFDIRQTEYITKLTNGLLIALAVYMISYQLIKRKYVLQVEKPQKLATTGIGIYFIAWIVFWVIFYTIFAAI